MSERLYVLDFAGGGAVHLLGTAPDVTCSSMSLMCTCTAGGVAGLVISLFAKLQEYRDKKKVSPSLLAHFSSYCTFYSTVPSHTTVDLAVIEAPYKKELKNKRM